MKSFSRFSSVAVPIMLCALVSYGAEQKYEKTFSVSPGGTLVLTTDFGDVKIEGKSGGDVSVKALWKGDDKEVRDFEVTAQQTSSGVEIRGDAKRSHSWFGFGHDLSVEFTVSVPTDYSVRAQTSGGDVEIRSVKGSVNGETSGGDVRAYDLSGKVVMNTSGGDIHAEKVSGDVRMETSGGDIRVRSVTGNVDVSTSGGDIVLEGIEGKVSAETSGGDIRISVQGPNKGIFSETSGGDIDIRIANNVGANIDASSSGGDVVCDIPVTVTGRVSEGSIHGTINGGGSLIKASTSGGDVRIHTGM